MLLFFFFFKQKTAYEMRISDWSSDVCSSDLCRHGQLQAGEAAARSADIHLAAERRHAVRVVIPAIAETTARGQPEILRGQRSVRSLDHGIQDQTSTKKKRNRARVNTTTAGYPWPALLALTVMPGHSGGPGSRG